MSRLAALQKDLDDNRRRARALIADVWRRMNEGWRPTPLESQAVMANLTELVDEAVRLRKWLPAACAVAESGVSR